MQIKTATIQDAEEIHHIHTNAVKFNCKNFYTENQITIWLKNRSPEGYHKGIKNGEMFIAEENGEIAGFGHAIPGQIAAVFVDPAFQGKGVGKLLLEHGLKLALQEKQPVMVESSLNAENFYKRNGFIKIREDFCIRNGIKLPIIIMEYSA